MSDYDLDNVGSGFNLEEDEENLDSMLNVATAAAEKDDETDWNGILSQNSLDDDEVDGEKVSTKSKPDKNVKEKQVEEVVPENEKTDVKEEVPAKSIVDSKPEVEKDQEGKIEEKQSQRQESSKRITNLKNLDENIKNSFNERVAEANRAIKIIEEYKKFSNDSKQIVVQFLTNGAAKELPPGEIVVRAEDSDPSLEKAMSSLYEASALEKLPRAFFLMGLDSSELRNVGELITVFANEPDSKLSDLEYARVLVEEIDKISQDDKKIKYVEATQKILSLAKE